MLTRPFIKHLADLIGSLRLIRDFGKDFAFQHVRQNKAGMAVCLANPSGRHINFTHRQKFLLTNEIRTCYSGDVIACSRFEIPIWLIDRAGF